MNRSISVLIRTFNSAKTLGKVLTALDLLEGDEIIVVDSASTDETLTIAAQFSVKIIEAPGPFNYSRSLNLGFVIAGNPWVLVLSSHATPQIGDFLNLYRAEIEQLPAQIAVIYGPSHITGKSNFDQNESIHFYTRQSVENIINLCGNGNALYRRKTWEDIPFDETIRTAEDKIWLNNVLKKNWEFAFLPTVLTLNQNQASLKYMYRKGYGDAKARPRENSYRPMNLYQLGGALKNQALLRLHGQIDHGNWLRYSAHIVGQFFGSYGKPNNHPEYR